MGPKRGARGLASLTPQQLNVLSLIREGLSNKEIATRSGLEIGTIKVYSSQLFTKLGVRSRLQAALYIELREPVGGCECEAAD